MPAQMSHRLFYILFGETLCKLANDLSVSSRTSENRAQDLQHRSNQLMSKHILHYVKTFLQHITEIFFSGELHKRLVRQLEVNAKVDVGAKKTEPKIDPPPIQKCGQFRILAWLAPHQGNSTRSDRNPHAKKMGARGLTDGVDGVAGRTLRSNLPIIGDSRRKHRRLHGRRLRRLHRGCGLAEPESGNGQLPRAQSPELAAGRIPALPHPRKGWTAQHPRARRT